MPFDHYLTMSLNFALGLGVGTYGTLVGAGGGFLLVPLFLLAYQLPHELAVGTSLAIVSLNALSGTIGYVRGGRIYYRAGLVFALCTFPGAILGASLVTQISGSTFQKVFGALLSAAALYLFFRRRRSSDSGAGGVLKVNLPLGGFISVFVGLISSLFGIGGGIVHVPLMIEVLGFPISTAVATSHFILGFTALAGTAVHLFHGHVALPLAMEAGLGAVIGAQAGVWLSKRVRADNVLRALSLALLAVGIRLMFQ